NVSDADLTPTVKGSNRTVAVHDPWIGIGAAMQVCPSRSKSEAFGPVIATAVIVAGRSPVWTVTTVPADGDPILTLPNDLDVGVMRTGSGCQLGSPSVG